MPTFLMRNTPIGTGRIFYYSPAIVAFEGKVVPNPPWIGNDCFTLQVKDRDFPLRVIKKSDLVGEPPKIEAPIKRTFKIASSDKKSYYTVTQEGKTWICDCKGYQFRYTCRHIVAAKNQKS